MFLGLHKLFGLYRASQNKCKPCHEQCGSSCHGPGANNCTSCKHLRDSNFCISKCMLSKYEEKGICRSCNENCVGGCSGPSSYLGRGGCDGHHQGEQLCVFEQELYLS